MNEVLVQSHQEQTAFRVCRKYGVSSAHYMLAFIRNEMLVKYVLFFVWL